MRSAVLFVSVSVLLIAAEIHSPQPTGLTVHEWGTFTSVAGEDGSAVDWDALGCKSDLPGFVNDFGYRGFKWRLSGTVRMETPVMYFYSSRELDAHVKVAFPQGLITEWYPRAEYAVDQKFGDGSIRRLQPNLNWIDTSMRKVTGSIEWKNIRIQPDTAPALPIESGPNRYYAARGTDAAPITVGDQHEKFLFYRGVGRFPIPLSARISGDGKIAVENRGPDTVPSVILFENRGGRLGYQNVGAIDAGQTARPSAPRESSFSKLRSDLETALVGQGLFPKEAQAMVETWRDSWFEEGSRLIYIVPSRAVDAILPLQIEPAPSQIARVFVGRIELITPETMRPVEEAIANGDWSRIDRYGRFLDPILRSVASQNPAKANQIEQFRRDMRASFVAGHCQ
jgi:hypothetical protein